MRASAPSRNPMKQQKPLDILEIRTNVGWYLDPSDVYSCALVCRDWAQTFIPLLWYTIDFLLQPQIPLSILKKQARHVRRLECLELSEKEEDTLRLLCFSSRVRHLRHLSIAFCESEQVNIHGFDLLRRNRASLTFLKIVGKPFESEVDIVPAQYCIPPDVLVHPTASRLTDLSLHKIILTREGFAHMLRSSPCLKKLNLATSNILTGGYIDTVGAKGTGRDRLTDQDSEDDYYSEEEDADRELYLSELESISSIKSSVVKSEVKACCPDLCTVGFSSSPSPAVEELITHAFENLVEVHFEKHNYTVGVFHSLLHHHSTLTSITTYADPGAALDSRLPEPIDDLFKDQGRVIQLLFQILPLKTVCFEEHEMKIEWMEEKPWRGTLEELSVRIEGLDTEQKIEKALSAWVECWSKYKDVLHQSANLLLEDSSVGFSGTIKQDVPADIVVKREPVDEKHMTAQANGNQGERGMLAPRVPNPLDFFVDDGSLEARVTRFLLQQPNLRSVWLGSEYWSH
ncbi:hypothetical protein BGX30_002516 [Mortierella sp. GBA39]|nr:hypothetical protein BGX30_002516 [Mortierella sp. GBA39]